MSCTTRCAFQRDLNYLSTHASPAVVDSQHRRKMRLLPKQGIDPFFQHGSLLHFLQPNQARVDLTFIEKPCVQIWVLGARRFLKRYEPVVFLDHFERGLRSHQVLHASRSNKQQTTEKQPPQFWEQFFACHGRD